MNQTQITVTGLVATTPRHLITSEGLPITSFRLASQRGETKDYSTNWYTVTAFKALAINAKSSIGKGDRIVITGNIIIRDWGNAERSGTTVEIEAIAIGHDLAFGSSTFTRNSYGNGEMYDPEDIAEQADN